MDKNVLEMMEDYEISPEDVEAENDNFYRDQWKNAIATDDTVLGFDDWVEYAIDDSGWQEIVCSYGQGYRRLNGDDVVYYRVN